MDIRNVGKSKIRPGFAFNRTTHLLRARILEATREAMSKLTPEESALLMALDDYGGTLQMKDFVQLTSRDKSTITRQIDGLVRKKMVRRTKGETDGREMHVSITSLGAREIDRLNPHFERIRTRMMHGLTREQMTETLNVLEKIQANLSSDEPLARPSASSKKKP